MRYPETVEYLYALGNEIKTVKFGLTGIRTVLAELGDPQGAFPSVHAAGTNGKGSTCAMIESGLRAAGRRTGLYTSPHLMEPTERIRISGEKVSAQEFADAFARVHEANDRLLASGELEHHTTYFETVTAMAFLLFCERGVETAVVETGLGGRLDATNVLSPRLCVITPIDFDHEAWLGNSIEQIAGEKAGILKPRVPAVIAHQRPEAADVIRARARELDCSLIDADGRGAADVSLGPSGSAFRYGPLQVLCPLPGAHQIGNTITAIEALRALGISDDAIEAGVARTEWPARLQRISTAPDILLDGAHNPAGARALAEYLQTFFVGRQPVWLVYGAMRDKSVEEITEILFPLADHVIVTAPDSPRAVTPEALASTSEHPSIVTSSNTRQALELARKAPADVVVVITGSLYLAGEVLALLQ
ncbi:MAG TPA: folylpolyglutamate synthase/dihydrofolate synthase family protein [Bryobacteraceae bacterium]|nr:folylpolyglutamate synthase/dihydrofolate synthase family protein [Bryobacteraceae bacterium]